MLGPSLSRVCGQAADADAAKQHVPTREELKAHEADAVRQREKEERAEERRRNRPSEPASNPNRARKGGVPSMLTRDKSAPASLSGSAGMGAGRLQRPGMA